MKRDMDLAREILFQMEASDNIDGWTIITLNDKNQEIISYHIKLLFQAHLIEADHIADNKNSEWKAKTITWQGHEFLDAIRDDSNWKKAKGFIISKGGSITFEALKISLSLLLKQQLGIS